jgi:hypothetical protein
MPKCQIDPTIQRVEADGFKFPLGVYPVEPLTPKAGYSMDFEPADGGEEPDDQGDRWEEWPDRYMFDVVISADRLDAFVRALLSMMPGRIYPILDILGQDAYREVDPYVAYELVGQERFIDALRRYRPLFLEDGLCGFGAMVDEPHFFYFFVDEHKIVTIRAETLLKERVEKILSAFDLESMESPAGADSAAHEHRTVLDHSAQRPDLLTLDEIVESLREEWRLSLNIDPDTNLDDDGHELGMTFWRCLVRVTEKDWEKPRYVESLIVAGTIRKAEELALDAGDEIRPGKTQEWEENTVVTSDRLTPQQATEFAKDRGIPASKLPKFASGRGEPKESDSPDRAPDPTMIRPTPSDPTQAEDPGENQGGDELSSIASTEEWIIWRDWLE